ncbi:hypothetical protein CR513_27371, partial [Mucuna pruriens]
MPTPHAGSLGIPNIPSDHGSTSILFTTSSSSKFVCRPNKKSHSFFCRLSQVDQGQQKSLNRDKVVPARPTPSRPSQIHLGNPHLVAQQPNKERPNCISTSTIHLIASSAAMSLLANLPRLAYHNSYIYRRSCALFRGSALSFEFTLNTLHLLHFLALILPFLVVHGVALAFLSIEEVQRQSISVASVCTQSLSRATRPVPRRVNATRLGLYIILLHTKPQLSTLALKRLKTPIIKLAPLPGTQMENNDRTLKELAAPDVVYQPWCIQYPQLEPAQTYELKSGLIHLLPKFHGLAGEDPHKHLKEFHV